MARMLLTHNEWSRHPTPPSAFSKIPVPRSAISQLTVLGVVGIARRKPAAAAQPKLFSE